MTERVIVNRHCEVVRKTNSIWDEHFMNMSVKANFDVITAALKNLITHPLNHVTFDLGTEEAPVSLLTTVRTRQLCELVQKFIEVYVLSSTTYLV